MQEQNTIEFSPFLIGTMRLGDWGVKMSSIELENFIDACLDLGLKDFDHADIYGHYTEESRFGTVIKRRQDLKSKIQITTKCGIKLTTPNRPDHSIKSYDSTKSHIIKSTENSLTELGIEHIDVLLIHRPDYLMDPNEIAEAFSQLQSSGKVRAFGVSNFTNSQVELLHKHFPLITNQVEISLLHTNAIEDGTLDQCMLKRIIPTAWSPFGGGALFSTSDDPKILRIQKTATALGEKYNADIDQILLAWIDKHPAGIIPVLGSTKIERIEKALASKKISLTHEEWYLLWEAAIGQEVA